MTSLFAQVEIKAGNLTVVKFDTKSDDGTLFVDYAMELAPTFGESQVTGCLRFNGSQSLLKREPKTFSAISATGAFLGPDNLFHIKLTDKFKDMRRLAQPCGPAVSGKSMDNPGARPNLPSPVPAAEDPGRVETPSSTFTPPTIVVPDASVPNPPPGAAAPGLDQTPGVMPSPGPPAPGPDNPGSAAPPGHGSAEAIHGGGDRGALPPASASGVEAPR